LGTLRAAHVGVLLSGLLLLWLASSTRAFVGLLPPGQRRVLRHGAHALVVLALVTPLLAARRPPPSAGLVARGVWLWRSTAVVVELDGTAGSVDALRELRERDVGAIDLLVVRTASSPAAVVARDLRTRYDPAVVWAPKRHQVRGAATPAVGARLEGGGLVVDVLEVEDRLRVQVRAA
jgi:hypothetical protein